ncbi:hypothetical protein [Mesomycoplasma hyorhinis]|uniref:hypothetical protein n=1 Tax=Mesomycoplasma hyorhinis TaxID=2100 RepID=UPI001C042DAB|nr:hypothetical protein [Mesomycoplasma hyorhinis]
MKKRSISILLGSLSASVPIVSFVSCSEEEVSKISLVNLESNSSTINFDNIKLENKDKTPTKEDIQALYKFQLKKEKDQDFKTVTPTISLINPISLATSNKTSSLSLTISGLEKNTKYAFRVLKGDDIVLLPAELQTFTTKPAPELSSINGNILASDNTTIKFLWVDLNPEEFKNENNTLFSLTYKQISDNGLPLSSSPELIAQTKISFQEKQNTQQTTANQTQNQTSQANSNQANNNNITTAQETQHVSRMPYLLFKLQNLKPKSEYIITKISKENSVLTNNASQSANATANSSESKNQMDLTFEKNLLPFSFSTKPEIENVQLFSLGNINADGQTSDFEFKVSFAKEIQDFSKTNYEIFLQVFTTKDESQNPTPEDQKIYVARAESPVVTKNAAGQDETSKFDYIFKAQLPRGKFFKVIKATNNNQAVTISDAILEVNSDSLENK